MRKVNGVNVKMTPAVGGAAYFFLIACYLVLSLAGQGVLRAAGVTDGVLFYAVNFFLPVIAAAAVIVETVLKSGAGLNAAALKKTVKIAPSAPAYFLAAILAGAGMIAGLGFVNQLVADAMTGAGLNAAETDLPLGNSSELALFTVFAAFLPAAAEECFFRGLLLNCLTGGNKGDFKTDASAVFVSALCFAVYHCSLAQTAYQFIYGALLAFLTLKAGGILPAFIAHFMNNFAVLIISYARLNIDLTNGITIAIGLTLAAAAIALIFLCGRKKPRNVKDGEKRAYSGAEKGEDKNAEKGGNDNGEKGENESGEKRGKGVTDKERSEKNELKIFSFFFPFGAAGIAVCAILIICSAVAV